MKINETIVMMANVRLRIHNQRVIQWIPKRHLSQTNYLFVEQNRKQNRLNYHFPKQICAACVVCSIRSKHEQFDGNEKKNPRPHIMRLAKLSKELTPFVNGQICAHVQIWHQIVNCLLCGFEFTVKNHARDGSERVKFSKHSFSSLNCDASIHIFIQTTFHAQKWKSISWHFNHNQNDLNMEKRV